MRLESWFGTLDLGEDGKVLASDQFSKNVRELALRSLSLREAGKGVPPAGFDLRSAALACGFVRSSEEYDSLLHEVTLDAAKLQISGALTPDQRIILAVEALDDVNETANVLSERLSEWYGGYFPESGLSGETLGRFVAKYGSRKNVAPEDPLYARATDSMGAELEAFDEELLKGFAKSVCSLYDRRKQIEAYIESSMENIAPNLSLLAGPMLGARLISIAGSLEKLAAFPSSTVQVIGANKALFKHLRSRAPSPKHGIIFSHPLINTSPWWQRGKIARAVAAKLSLAARMDLYSGKKVPSLAEKLDAKVQQIRLQNPEAPRKKPDRGLKPKGKKKRRQ